ncbi:hypothetical protein Bbelb_162470 [Branchiostoma belcheri]|nr:hypothetical protein Bbelb_162470 [Branchiostoma belcheri]
MGKRPQTKVNSGLAPVSPYILTAPQQIATDNAWIKPWSQGDLCDLRSLAPKVNTSSVCGSNLGVTRRARGRPAAMFVCVQYREEAGAIMPCVNSPAESVCRTYYRQSDRRARGDGRQQTGWQIRASEKSTSTTGQLRWCYGIRVGHVLSNGPN